MHAVRVWATLVLGPAASLEPSLLRLVRAVMVCVGWFGEAWSAAMVGD